MGDITRPERRLQLLHEGWRGAIAPFLLALALDSAYQIMTIRFVYPLELLFTATLLALVPYALLRGPFNRLARLFLPVARSPPAVEPAGDKKFDSLEETEQGRANTMSSESKNRGLVEACRDGDPKGRLFSGQGRAGALRAHLP